MKKNLLLLSLVWLGLWAVGQSPQGISYQTIIRDGDGQPIVNTAITLKMSIRAEAATGEVVYSETHAKVSNAFGLVNLVIGQGTPVVGQFPAINWGAAAHFLETAIDLTGGGQFNVLGVTQFLSVPYALNSENGMPDGSNPGDMLYWNGTAWAKITAGINGQVLTLSNGIPTWGGVQLPVLYTTAVQNITATSASSGGNIASDGGSPVIARGICWSLAQTPTIENNKTINGSGTGAFGGTMTGLSTGTTYFVRAYATNSAGTTYGNQLSFTTLNGNIVLSTTAASAITTVTAVSGGNITNSGGTTVTARGVCWSTTENPTTANSKTTNGSGNGIFVSELTGLAANTLYYVRAYATNSLGPSYGNQQSFTTLSGIISLTTAEVTEITAVSAISGGEITNDGGSVVTSRGVCWSNLQNPTIADSKTTDGAGNGIFVSSLTNLLPDSLYYVRAYATNGVGTFYGNEISFQTLFLSCENQIQDIRDGKIYNIIKIGNQCWFKENLNIGTMINGDQEMADNAVIEKYCFDNNPANCEIYGGLYQWDEMMQYSTTPSAQGICPSGWHLPTDAEWTTLTTFLGGESVAGGKMKEPGTTHWASPNTDATNSSGFTALPGGYRSNSGPFTNITRDGHWWSSTEYSTTYAWYRVQYYYDANVYRVNCTAGYGFSVRCLRDL